MRFHKAVFKVNIIRFKKACAAVQKQVMSIEITVLFQNFITLSNCKDGGKGLYNFPWIPSCNRSLIKKIFEPLCLSVTLPVLDFILLFLFPPFMVYNLRDKSKKNKSDHD